MNYLQPTPSTHRQQPIVKVDFNFDEDLIALIKVQKRGTVFKILSEVIGAW